MVEFESDRHYHNRWPVDAHRLAQDAGERLSLIRDLDTFAGWSQVRQCHLPAFDLLPVRRFHLRLVMDEEEGREVIVDAGTLQTFPAVNECFFASASRPSFS